MKFSNNWTAEIEHTTTKSGRAYRRIAKLAELSEISGVHHINRVKDTQHEHLKRCRKTTVVPAAQTPQQGHSTCPQGDWAGTVGCTWSNLNSEEKHNRTHFWECELANQEETPAQGPQGGKTHSWSRSPCALVEASQTLISLQVWNHFQSEWTVKTKPIK